MHFETVIGLEVHVELKTESKMFSPSPAHFGAKPNSNTNVIDLAYPGVLPVVNRRAVDWAMRTAKTRSQTTQGTSTRNIVKVKRLKAAAEYKMIS